MNGGGSKGEVRWELLCDDEYIVRERRGRSPFDEELTVPACARCRVSMKDTYGDGWQGGTWNGFNQTFSGPADGYGGWLKSPTFNTGGCVANVSNSSNDTTSSNSTQNETSPAPRGTVTSKVYMNEGGSKSEVRWELLCDDE